MLIVRYIVNVIIDFHTHIFPPKVIKNRALFSESDPYFAELFSSPEVKLATAEDIISSMDEENVDVSVVLNYGWVSHELCAHRSAPALFPRRHSCLNKVVQKLDSVQPEDSGRVSP